MIENDYCANCGCYIGNATATGVAGLYDPNGPDILLCEPCFFAEEDAVEAAGTNNLPDRLARYKRNIATQARRPAVSEMPPQSPVPADHPLRRAWDAYLASERGANAMKWAEQKDHVKGSMWHAFISGFQAATERAGNLHEQVNTASDQERHDDSPGAGAMGAVIEYRDLIRAL